MRSHNHCHCRHHRVFNLLPKVFEIASFDEKSGSAYWNYHGSRARQKNEEFPILPKLEEATTILWSGENVEHNYDHDFANDSSNVAGEEIQKEGIEEQPKEAENVFFEEPLIYKETMPYVPHVACTSRLHKSNWYKLFSELIKPLFQVNIYLPLLNVIRNTSASDKYFHDLITYRLKFETSKFG
ncbi:hypothetical protein Dsin_004403 [Dipteronia sinensis]|uniref:Uncharacterized protein n=1 Tax=Dipteronia sinensis TaxID=43782 RepID=A0AAE0ELU9_9ROSI|nr:hypothetical protein Dsin_004403 [Dipteronia sinensis]